MNLEDIIANTADSLGDGVNNNNSTSPDNSDDFVLVPNNLPPVDSNEYDKK